MEEFEIIYKKELEKNRKIFKQTFLILFIILIAFLSYIQGLKKGENKEIVANKTIPLERAFLQNKSPEKNENVDFSLFWKVWDTVKEKHIDRDKLDAQKMVYGAINGMLRATGDPHTSFFSPEEKKAFSEDLNGSFEGIGAELSIKDDLLTVIAPLDESPAQKAGLRAGDKVLKIGDKIASDMTIDESVDLIRGKKGTEVKLTVLSKEEEQTKEITIIRDTIKVESVKLEFKEGNIVLLKITQFRENVDREFNNAASKITSSNTKGIILDLRNNPGGLLDKSISVASKMIPRGKIVVIEEDNFGKKESFKTIGGDVLSQIPTVVLIDGGSASASEILAGSLRDNQSITLIGEKSFGKGTVQELINLQNNSSVKVTIAKWLTPNGDYIMEKGINPDIEVKMTIDDYKNDRDPQLEKALEVLKERIK